MPTVSEKRSSGPWQLTVPPTAPWRSTSARTAWARRAERSSPGPPSPRKPLARTSSSDGARLVGPDGGERLVELVGLDAHLADAEAGELLGRGHDVEVASASGRRCARSVEWRSAPAGGARRAPCAAAGARRPGRRAARCRPRLPPPAQQHVDEHQARDGGRVLGRLGLRDVLAHAQHRHRVPDHERRVDALQRGQRERRRHGHHGRVDDRVERLRGEQRPRARRPAPPSPRRRGRRGRPPARAASAQRVADAAHALGEPVAHVRVEEREARRQRARRAGAAAAGRVGSSVRVGKACRPYCYDRGPWKGDGGFPPIGRVQARPHTLVNAATEEILRLVTSGALQRRRPRPARARADGAPRRLAHGTARGPVEPGGARASSRPARRAGDSSPRAARTTAAACWSTPG